jgi:FkbM family methyltransferase
VIDLGANQGAFSKQLKQLYQCKAYAIEPNDELYGQLLRDNVEAFNYAITPQNGPVEFFVSNNPEASSLLANYENVWGVNRKISVEGISFHTLVQQLELDKKTIEIVKVDIEGGELALIESLSDMDVINVKQITIEFHDWLNKDLHAGTIAAIRKLVSLGFRAYTDAPHHNAVVEMLFLNRRLVDLSLKQQVNLWIFRRFAFLNYN